ncbi:MAG: SMP-30/gluconolactonase/LRE family protein [Candidatus Latescibacterota bacterium]
MKRFKLSKVLVPVSLSLLLSTLFLSLPGCSKSNQPAWKATNDKLIKENDIKVRERTDLVETGITPSLEPGKVTPSDSLKVIEIAPGVKSMMYWGKAVLVSWITMAPNAEIPKETLSTSRMMVMFKGSVDQLVNGKMEHMECTDPAPGYFFSTGFIGYKHALILDKGAENAVKAGPKGAQFVEIYAPMRLDYLEKAGVTPPKDPNFGTFAASTRYPSNKVFDFNDIQRSTLIAQCWSRLLNNKDAQASFLFMEPDSKFALHNHPEEQLMIVLRGSTEELILDQKVPMKVGDALYLPAYYVHGGTNSPQGCDVLDVFWPVREADYQVREKERYDAYNKIIPAGEEPKLVADIKAKQNGNPFLEGGVYVKGKLIFSGMFFDIPSGTWKSDAKKSNLLSLDLATGKVKTIIKGMQTNGMSVMPNGNLVVCNMAGHQVIEVTPEGKLVKVLASKLSDGTRIDGPNDVVCDAKGGFYFTDPQFIFDKPARSGKTVNYIKPTGEVIEVVKPGEFGMENGIELSPDGKLLYVNNTYHDKNRMSDVSNHVAVYDVKDDGTLANKRIFCMIFCPASEYDGETRHTSSDGCAMDEEGNLYEATAIGCQIFNPKGEYIGTIHTPFFPVNICFGGEDNSTLYLFAWDKIYSIKTNVKGLVLPKK